MLIHQGVYLPDGEKHLVEWMTRAGEMVDGCGTYQIKKLRRALSYCNNFRTAVDIGGHAGLWSMQLEKRFYRVHAFEPVAAHRECFKKNMKTTELKPGEETLDDSEWVRLHACALGDHEGSVKITTEPTSSGDSRVDGDGDIPLRTLDSFNLQVVDFIKLDCEGYELFALRGGIETIKRDMPVIIVEQKPGRAQHFGLRETEAVDYLNTLGYRLAHEMAGDFIMVPE